MLAGLAIVAGASLLFLPESSVARLGLRAGDLRDALHLPLFFLLAIGMAMLGGAGRRGGGGRWLIVAVCLLGLAIGSELAQSQLGRSASWLDLLADVAGAAAGLLGWWCFSKRRWLFLGGTFLFAVVIFLVLARGAWLRPMALRAQEISYPQLFPQGDFTPWLVRVKDGTRVEWLGEEAGLRVTWQAGDWRGVEIRLAEGVAWQEATGLEMVLDNPGDRFTLGVRLDGRHGDRATSAVEVVPGTSRGVLERAGFAGDDKAWRMPRTLHLHGEAGAGERSFSIRLIRLVGPAGGSR